jgi:hypothetical protein
VTPKFYSRGAVDPARPWRPSDPWFFGHASVLGAVVILADNSFLAWTGEQDSVHRDVNEAVEAVRRFHERKRNSAPKTP